MNPFSWGHFWTKKSHIFGETYLNILLPLFGKDKYRGYYQFRPHLDCRDTQGHLFPKRGSIILVYQCKIVLLQSWPANQIEGLTGLIKNYVFESSVVTAQTKLRSFMKVKYEKSLLHNIRLNCQFDSGWRSQATNLASYQPWVVNNMYKDPCKGRR